LCGHWPLINHNNWFTVLLVEEDEQFLIERLEDPLGMTFEKGDLPGLLSYMRTTILSKLAETDT
jgi:hypothetical protein